MAASIGRLALLASVAWLGTATRSAAAPPDDQSYISRLALPKAKPAKIDPKDDELRKLLKARYNEAVADMEFRSQQYKMASMSTAALLETVDRMTRSRLELAEQPADRVAILKELLDFAKGAEDVEKARVDAKIIAPGEVSRVRYLRLDVEIRLLRAQRDADKKK